MSSTSHHHPPAIKPTTVEAKVTIKGQVTLPNALRRRLGIRKGSRVRLIISAYRPAQVEPAHHTIGDLWRMVDAEPRSSRVMSLAEMDAARSRKTRGGRCPAASAAISKPRLQCRWIWQRASR